ncbi:MAG: molybdate ABC transporter substrate-binding protein [Syntrophales bacterium]|nr:molybdate ABC transporter substrate-binding protein [Syntrophales bacterium]
MVRRSGCGWVLLLVSVLWLIPVSVSAQERLNAAVAANFIQAFTEISQAFERKTGVKVEATFASTGSLYGQIANGAPYDLFLSADEDRPARLNREGAGERPFVYARGRCVLWSARKDFCRARDWRTALQDEDVKRVAIANPETAPYGTAARTALVKTGLWEALKQKWVFAQNIAQAFQYASTSATAAGFCAYSSVMSDEGKKGCFYRLEEAPTIVQSACILKRTPHRASVEAFAAFLSSPEAEAIKAKYGYQ